MFAFQAHALKKSAPAASTPSYTSSSEHRHIISPVLGFMGSNQAVVHDTVNNVKVARNMMLSGLFGIGGDYEFMLKNDFSIGGFFRYYMTSDTVAGVSVDESVFLLGPEVHAYIINTDSWRGYVGTGLTLVNLKHKEDNKGIDGSISPDMQFGIPFTMGFGYKINDQLTAGIEHRQVLALGEKINGWPVSDFMFRLAIGL
jgi:hypothetical protein